jgi:tRNA nucleotidyltransferase/poly(A) polymerase
MLRYPDEDSLIRVFFEISLRLLRAQNMVELQPLVRQLIDQTVRVKKIGASLLNVVPQANEERFSAYQNELVGCEALLLDLLLAICNYKRSQFKQPVDQDKFYNELSALAELTIPSKSHFPLIAIMHSYISMTAKVLMLSHNANLAETSDLNTIFCGLYALETIYLHECSQENWYFQSIFGVNENYFEEVRCGMSVMLKDVEAKTNCEHHVLMILDIMVNQIIVVHDKIDKQLIPIVDAQCRKLSSKNIELNGPKFQLQQYRDQLAQIDALLCRLNLSKYSHIRDALTDNVLQNQLKPISTVYAGFNSYKHVSVLTGLLDDSNLIEQIKLATSTMLLFLDKYDFMHLAVTLFPYQADAINEKKILIHQLRNTYFDAKLLLAEANTLLDQHPDLEDAVIDLFFLVRITSGMMFCINKSINHYFKDSVTTLQTYYVSFPHMRFDAMSSILGDLFKMKSRLDLEKKDTELERASVFYTIGMNIICFLEAYENKLNKLDAESSRVSKQFILDYYFSSLNLCTSNAESEFLLSAVYTDSIFKLMSELPSCSTYDFMKVYIINCSNLMGIEMPSIDSIYHLFPEECRNEIYLSLVEIFKNLHSLNNRISHSLVAFIMVSANKFLKYMAIYGDEKQKLNSKKMLEQQDRFYLELYSEAKRCFESFGFAKVITPFVNYKLSEIKKSFIPKSLPPKKQKNTNKTTSKKTKKEALKVANPLVTTIKRKPSIDSEFESVMDYFKQNLKLTESYYFKYLHSYDITTRAYALLGLAECLGKQVDIGKRDKLGKTLQIIHLDIMRQASCSVQHTVYSGRIKPRFEVLFYAWESSTESFFRPVKRSVSPLSTMAEISENSKIATTSPPMPQPVIGHNSFFAETKSGSSVKAVIAQKPAELIKSKRPSPTLDVMNEMRVKLPLTITLNLIQEKIIKLLHQKGYYPLIHGGAVVDTLFGIPYRDVDLLCFASGTELKKLLESIIAEFGIKEIRRNKNTDVFVIIFNANVNHKEEDLEIAFISKSGMSRDEQLREMARNFGINFTLYYDPIRLTVIDPLRQFERITKEKLIDVSQVLSVNLNLYFNNYPERILDALNKVAKYMKHNIILRISDDVKTSIANNNKSLLSCASLLINLNRFDKLFLQGYACQSFSVIENLQLLQLYFPMLTNVETEPLINACKLMDTLHTEASFMTMSVVQREERRSLFIANVLFSHFIASHDLLFLQQDVNLFYVHCKNYLEKINIYTSRELIPRIQDIWLDKIERMSLENESTPQIPSGKRP